MRTIVACFLSGVCGAWLVLSFSQPSVAPGQLLAQEKKPRQPANQAADVERRETRQPGPQLPGPEADEFATREPADLELTPDERINVAVYENVNRSVVNVTTKTIRGDGFLLEMTSEGAGSGSVLDKAGHILTNFHVIEGANQVGVTLYDGKTYEATFVGADKVNDTAVIRIDAAPEVLHPVTFGDSTHLKVGMRVFAIGNPFGLERTLTTGIISSLNRSLQVHAGRTIRSIIQIDAAINPGNSGGPLVDTRGHLIGVNTAIASKTGQNSGVGFAIPVNLIRRIVPQLIQHGRVTRPEAGISQVYQTDEGLRIALLTPGGPAERAGLRGPQVVRRRRGPFVSERIDRSAADLIVAVDGEKVKTGDDFLGLIERKNPGNRVVLSIVREGREVEVPLTLGGEEPPTPANPL